MRSDKKGFTLIELLVVIAIIAILSVIGMTQLASAREKARDSQRRLDLSQYQHQLTSYYDDVHELFPLVSGDMTGATVVGDHSATQDPTNATGVFSSSGVLIPDYFAQEVSDPLLGREGHEYFYVANCNASPCSSATGATDYVLYVKMEIGDYYYALGPGGRIADVSDMRPNPPFCPGDAAVGGPTGTCTPPS